MNYRYRVEIYSSKTNFFSGRIDVNLADALELSARTMKEDHSATAIRVTVLNAGPDNKPEAEVLNVIRDAHDGNWHHKQTKL